MLHSSVTSHLPAVVTAWAFDNLTNCEKAVAAFELATGCSLPRRSRRRRRAAADSAGRFHRGPPGDLRAALVGWMILYWWPEDGWQRGTVARLCQRGTFSHVVAYIRQTSESALCGTADTVTSTQDHAASGSEAAVEIVISQNVL